MLKFLVLVHVRTCLWYWLIKSSAVLQYVHTLEQFLVKSAKGLSIPVWVNDTVYIKDHVQFHPRAIDFKLFHPKLKDRYT